MAGEQVQAGQGTSPAALGAVGTPRPAEPREHVRAVLFDLYATLLEVGPPPSDADARWQRLFRESLDTDPPFGRVEFLPPAAGSSPGTTRPLVGKACPGRRSSGPRLSSKSCPDSLDCRANRRRGVRASG